MRTPSAAVLAALALLVAGCGPGRPLPASAPGPVFLLGFDGLSPDLVERFEAEGAMPNFARLAREGAVAHLRSTIPMTSPPAWTTISTGTPPADHGIWSFWIPSAGDPRGRFVDASCRLAPAIWQDLTARGRTVGVVNVPITCPPDSVNGFMIAGFPYPKDAPLTFPRELEAEIVAQGYQRDAWLGPPEAGHEEEWLDRIVAIEKARRKIGLGLLFERHPDFSFIVFTAPDRIQHHLWKFQDAKHPGYRPDAPARLKTAVRDIYVWCDDVLGEVTSRLPANATLFVVSDHGFGPAYVGVSKERVLAELGGTPMSTAQKEAAAPAAESRNLFGGDFHLAGADSAARVRFEESLARLTDEGRPVVAAVHDIRSESVRGFGLALGPDVVAEEADGYLFYPGAPNAPLTGPLPPRAFSGWHRRVGWFAARGHPIVPGRVRDLDLGDVPAMVMHLLGETVPRRYVQNVPKALFPPNYFIERPMRFKGDVQEGLRRPGAFAETTVDPAVAEQLRSLGYLK
ncbi:MAG: alkaline phosphatase family protein [bacterium]